MNIRLIAAGRLKEHYLKEAFDEYKKRLSAYCSFSAAEIQAEPILDESLSEKYIEIEADRILRVLKPDSYVISLEINGCRLSSEKFAQKLKEIINQGVNDICFITGGANGLSSRISSIANFRLSFSDMTFTHQMMRILLAEQLYRAFKINAGEPYHR